MLPSIPGNVTKNFWECPQTSQGISTNILGNVLKCSAECRQKSRGMSSKIPENVARHSREYHQTFRGMSPSILGMSSNIPQNISGDVAKHFRKFPQTFREMPSIIRCFLISPGLQHHYSVQSGILSNLCFHTEYQTSIDQTTLFTLGSSLEILQSHVIATSLSMVTKN